MSCGFGWAAIIIKMALSNILMCIVKASSFCSSGSIRRKKDETKVVWFMAWLCDENVDAMNQVCAIRLTKWLAMVKNAWLFLIHTHACINLHNGRFVNIQLLWHFPLGSLSQAHLAPSQWIQEIEKCPFLKNAHESSVLNEITSFTQLHSQHMWKSQWNGHKMSTNFSSAQKRLNYEPKHETKQKNNQFMSFLFWTVNNSQTKGQKPLIFFNDDPCVSLSCGQLLQQLSGLLLFFIPNHNVVHLRFCRLNGAKRMHFAYILHSVRTVEMKVCGWMMRKKNAVCVFMQLFCERTRMVGNGKYKIHAMF